MDQSNLEQLRLLADTPESALIYNPNVDPKSIEDVMLCALQRNAALVDVLIGDILERDQFDIPIPVVRNLLWLLQGQFAEMTTIMSSYRHQIPSKPD